MSLATTTSTIDIVNKVVQDFDVEMSENLSAPMSPGYEIQESIKNMTSTSCSYSSSFDASRAHLRLKMSSGGSKSGLVLPGGLSSMKIPSLLQKLPCHGLSNKASESCVSTASAVTLSALSVIEDGFGVQENQVIDEENPEEKEDDNVKNPTNHVFDFDAIDIDNITIGDLRGLQAADGDTLRAKYLNKLSRKEREHVLQDIHGVADVMEESTNVLFVNDSLKKLQVEIDHELVVRKNVNKANQRQKEGSASTPKLPALEEQLGKLQEKLDQLVRRRNALDSSMKGSSDFPPRKQLSAKNQPMFGKLGDIGGFGYKNKIRPTLVPSSCFGVSSSFFSPTTAMAKSSLSSTSASNVNEVQQDAVILSSEDAIAYEQALAQCRGRRRERNNSLFRPYLTDDSAYEVDDLDDEGLHIDVEQREFRLSFLRAERYDSKKAATRLIEYFEEKRRLFGVDKLTTKIQLKDVDAETTECLESGQISLLPGRDRAGRAIIVGTNRLAINKEKRENKNSILRAFWILWSIALEDVETETNGVVFVNYAIGEARENNNDGYDGRIRDWGNVLRALPLRIASIHWCVENHTLKQAANLSALMLGGSNFVRVRCHAGSDMEVQYDLMTFGIPTSLFPISMLGKIDMSRHLDFLKQRKTMEASSLLNKALALLETPNIDDCIALDVSVDDQDPETAIVAPKPVVTSGNSHNNTSNGFHRENQTQYQQEQQYQKQEINRTTGDQGYATANNNMNKISSSSFNDAFCFIGNRNPMQVQSAVQQQYQQQQQQRLNSFQQPNLGLNMNMGIGMVQQFSQTQQLQRQQHTGITGESKSGIPYSMEPVLVPGELDILLGRGRGAQNHKGNIHYRQVVETFRSRYEQIPQKGAKTQLIREVVAVIYDNGGRFLKLDGFGRWIPVDPEVARDKVSHSFRNQKRLSVGVSTPMAGESSSKKRSRDETK